MLSAQEVNRATEIDKIVNIGANTESIEFDAKKTDQTSLHYILCGSNERDLICQAKLDIIKISFITGAKVYVDSVQGEQFPVVTNIWISSDK
jgi:hypothetical protein